MLNPPELNTRELDGKPCKVCDVREVFTQNFNRFLRQYTAQNHSENCWKILKC